jgi:hypothetical protein
MIEVKQKIIGYEVVDAADNAEQKTTKVSDNSNQNSPVGKSDAATKQAATAEIIQMHEKLERPERILGSTYKIKTPQSEHALYVTINDVVLNQGTEHEIRRPYEIFINSKNMDHFQWIVALTRIISAVFRKGGDVTFLADELRSVFDPRGGYFKSGGKFKPSLVAEIGDAIECHMKMIGMIEDEGMDERQREILEAKRKEYEAFHKTESPPAEKGQASEFPPMSQLCKKCHTKAVISMDGCMTCLNCGDSKCG